MNKKLIIGLAIVIIAIVAGGVYFFTNNTKPSTSQSGSTGSNIRLTATKACAIFTLAEAKQLLGEAATEGSNTGATNSTDISVDNCSYTNNATSVAAIRVITVMARSALTSDGLNSNSQAFETDGAAHPSNAVSVPGYGEKAFWDPTTHQLAILKGNTWIGVIYGGTNPANNTLDDAKKVADLAI